jgi:hypothetical protein
MDNPCGKHGKTVLPSGEARKIEEKKTVLVSFSMEKPVFHARHCRVPSKVPNEPSSRILLAARSSSAIFHARLFDSAVRFGISAGGAARLWCSTTIFFAKI